MRIPAGTFCLALLLHFQASAGTVGKISGVVTDRVTGLPLEGVNVVLVGLPGPVGAATDALGR